MKVSALEIKAVAGIARLAVTFDPRMNIVCGPNGVGKTTLLESIAHCFGRGPSNVLKTSVSAEQSQIRLTFESETGLSDIEIGFNESDPRRTTSVRGRGEYSSYLMSLKTTRTLSYQALDAIARDTVKNEGTSQNEAMQGVHLQDVKNWFVNRYLYSAHDVLTPQQLENFNLAKQTFGVLDPRFQFARVDPSTNEIMIDAPSGRIYYEYLSSGFRSVIALIFGLIKEIEFRFAGTPTSARDFDGVVLIDEIELHLHPTWQSRIASILMSTFPKAQFIATTHSPHVVQSADRDQIIPLGWSPDGVIVQQPPSTSFGFQFWTLDEVLVDLMGMEDTRSDLFNQVYDQFARAVDSGDRSEATKAFEKLDAALHPANAIRKLFAMQLASMDGAHGST